MEVGLQLSTNNYVLIMHLRQLIIFFLFIGISKEENTICENAFRIADKKDCTSYRECYNSKWVVYTCPPEHVFDLLKRICVRGVCIINSFSESSEKKMSENKNDDLKNRNRNSVTDIFKNYNHSRRASNTKDYTHMSRSKRQMVQKSFKSQTINSGGDVRTTIWYYTTDGPSYKFTIPGELPESRDQMIDWIEQNSDRYQTTLVPYGGDATVESSSSFGTSSPFGVSSHYKESHSFFHRPDPFQVVSSMYAPEVPYRPSPTNFRPRPSMFESASTNFGPVPTNYRPDPTNFNSIPLPMRPDPINYPSIPLPSRPDSTNYRPTTTEQPSDPQKPPKTWRDILPSNCGYSGIELREAVANRVINGEPIAIEDNPWQVAIASKRERSLRCGATIISSKHVLTASHCFVVGIDSEKRILPKSNYVIKAGGSEYKEAPYTYNILELFVHKFYENDHKRNDIALILINGVFTWNVNVYPICLPAKNADYSVGRKCRISGWGRKESEKATSVLQLHGAVVGILPGDDCKRENNAHTRVSKGMFCAGDYEKGQVDTCQGDSGGPFACSDEGRGTLFGITSWGVGCARAKYPGVYTKVSEYRNWIEDRLEASMDSRNRDSLTRDEDIGAEDENLDFGFSPESEPYMSNFGRNSNFRKKSSFHNWMFNF